MARLDNSGEMNRNNQQLGTELKQKMSESGQAARQKLSEKTEALTEKAVNLSEQQKSIGAQQLAGVASAVHTAAGDLERQMPQAANYVRAAADKLDSAAAALRERRVDELLNDISEFARERPLLVFGGAVLVGLAITRFVKSSASDGQLMDQSSSRRSSPRTQPTQAMQSETPLTPNQPPHFVPSGDTIDRAYEGTA